MLASATVRSTRSSTGPTACRGLGARACGLLALAAVFTGCDRRADPAAAATPPPPPPDPYAAYVERTAPLTEALTKMRILFTTKDVADLKLFRAHHRAVTFAFERVKPDLTDEDRDRASWQRVLKIMSQLDVVAAGLEKHADLTRRAEAAGDGPPAGQPSAMELLQLMKDLSVLTDEVPKAMAQTGVEIHHLENDLREKR
jgi:hypothetical protein